MKLSGGVEHALILARRVALGNFYFIIGTSYYKWDVANIIGRL